MRKETVLVHVPCDVRRLPLNAFEGYLLSLVDGRLTLEELAEIAGTTVAQITRHAAHLIDVGAVVVAGEAGRPARRNSGQSAAVKRSTRAPSSARDASSPPSRRGRRPSATMPRSERSPRSSAPRSPTAHPVSTRGKPARSPSTRALSARPAPRSARPATSDSGAPIDETVRARILDLDARLGTLDHYTLLGVGRDAEKAVIKRAYFALAAEFHPDRYFGKKLGQAKAPLERIFRRLTDAHDTLSSRARRAEYDQLLPPLPPPPPPPLEPPPPSKRPAPRRTTRKMKAVEPRPPAPPPPSAPIAARPIAAPPIAASPAPPSGDTAAASDEALRRLYWSHKHNDAARRVAVFVDAAETALARDDVVAAVASYRLAQQIRDDVEIRQKIQAVEWRAKARIYESSVARGRAAEKEGRWPEAAAQFAQAFGAKPEAWTAERAARAIRMHGGDARRAVHLAEQAVLTEPQNVAYHLTLGEACLEAKLFARAAGEASRALAIAPDDERAKALAAAAKKR